MCLCKVVDVADDTISIRSLDWDRDRFDIEFGLQEGTTYNSFLIFGDKTCLVDASHEKFRDLYMKTLKDQLAERGRTLDYVVVSHTEPDHSGEQQPQAAHVDKRTYRYAHQQATCVWCLVQKRAVRPHMHCPRI